MEPRRLLSAVPWAAGRGAAGGLPHVQIQWHGALQDVRPGRWIVGIDEARAATALHTPANAALLSRVFAKLGGPQSAAARDGVAYERKLGKGLALVRAGDAAVYDQVLKDLRNLPGFKYVEPDFVVHASDVVPNDPSFTDQWALRNTGQSGGTAGADIGATAAWDTHTGSGDTVVAVVDTGIDYTHPDLAPNLWTNPGEVPGDGIDNDHDGYVDDVHGWNFVANSPDARDDNMHGTHVSGTIAAAGNNGLGVTGVNWHAQIMPLKFLNADGSGYTSDAVSAINYATMMRRDQGVNVAVVNNSWGGGGFSQALLSAIQANRNAGELFVAAAGNDGRNNDTGAEYPADYTVDNVIAVAATDRNDQLASFSNYGAATVHLGAPGVSILSTLPTYTTAEMQARGLSTGYGILSGTSMATPHVSGAAALIWDQAPSSTYQQVRQSLLANGDPIASLAGKTVTGERLNVAHSFLAPAGPVLATGQVSLDDGSTGGASGNGDGVVNPGETVALDIPVRNRSGGPATGVTATLSLDAPDANTTITRATASYGTVPGSGQAAGSASFLVQFSPSTPTPHAVTFRLTMTDDQGRTWTSTFGEAVYTSSRISGRATLDGAPAAGMTISYAGSASNLSGSVTTGADGTYSLLLRDGAYVLRAGRPGAVTSPPVQVTVPGDRAGVDFAFVTSAVSGRVADATGNPVSGATVGWTGDAAGSTTTAADGTYSFSAVTAGAASLSVYAAKSGYAGSSAKSITVPPSRSGLDFVLSGLSYSLTDLGQFSRFGAPDGTYGIRAHLSDAGLVVGSADYQWGDTRELLTYGFQRAYTWQNGTLAMLGAGDLSDDAVAVNGGGLIVGTAGDRPVQWDRGSETPLSFPGGATVGSIDDFGRIGGAADGDAFVWDRGAISYLNVNQKLTGTPTVADMNDAGAVVGTSSYNGFSHGWAYENGQVYDIGTLGGNDSVAYAVNSVGKVVGFAQTGRGGSKAVVWQNGVLTNLGDLGNDSFSSANGINDAAVIVGYSEGRFNGRHAFVYLGSQMYDLNDLVPAAAAAGWTLRSASDVNNSGQIVGWGTRADGSAGVFLLTPNAAPTPNYPPQADDVQTATVKGRPQPVTLKGFDPNWDNLRYQPVTGPAHGTLSSDDGDNLLTYTPAAGYTGTDSFTYKVNDGQAGSPVATVRILVSNGYRLIKLPTTGFAINQSNQVVGGESFAGFMWDGGVVNTLTGLNNAYDLNEAGVVAGGTTVQAATYDHGTVTLFPSPFLNSGVAVAINKQRTMAGYSRNPRNRDQLHAIVWRNGQAIDLGSFGSKGNATDWAAALGINDSDTAVGWSETDEEDPTNLGVDRAFIWKGGGPITQITGIGGLRSRALGIANTGSITGWYEPSLPYRHAFLYSEAAGMTDLGSPGVISQGRAVNSNGVVVGFAHTGDYVPDTFGGTRQVIRGEVYQSGMWADLSKLLVGSTNVIKDAYDINDAGWIVALSDDGFGHDQGVLLIPATDDPPPTATGQRLNTPENTPTAVTLQGGAPQGHRLTYLLGGPPAHGTISGFTNGAALTYTPGQNFTGPDAFTFQTFDTVTGQYSTFATVSINVTHVNQPPVASDGSGVVLINRSGVVAMPATDPDGPSLTWTVLTQPSHGALSNQTGGNITYTPAAGYTGPDSFTFSVSDGSFTSNAATVRLLTHPGFTVTDLGVLPGTPNSGANALNDLGEVVGAADTSGDSRAFIWRPGTGIADLGTLPGGIRAEADDINNADQIVGIATVPSALRAVLWPGSGGAAQDLNLTGTWAQHPYVNINGQVAGSFAQNSSGPTHGYFWDHGTFTDTGSLGSATNVFGANDAGQVVGTSQVPTVGGSRPFLWQNGSITALPTPAGESGVAYTINGDGLVAIWDTRPRITLFDYATGAASTVGPVAANASAFPASLNSRGQMVANVSVNGNPTSTALWTDGVLVNPTALITSGPTGIVSLADINDVGQIAGTAVINGVRHACLLTPNAFGDAAPAAPMRTAATDANVPLVLPLSGSDADGDRITWTVLTPPRHGRVNIRGSTLTYTPDPNFRGADLLTYAASDGYRLSSAATLNLNVGLSAPSVSSVSFNDGSAQRSMVKGITVTFDQPVSLDSGAFSVVGRNGAGAGTSVSWANPSGDGRTFLLTFAGLSVIAGSLADGVYDFRVTAAAIHAAAPTGPSMGADYTMAFHRLFGDVDGDGDSDNADLFQFKAAYGASSADPRYRWYLDYDANGFVDNADVFQEGRRRNLIFKNY